MLDWLLMGDFCKTCSVRFVVTQMSLKEPGKLKSDFYLFPVNLLGMRRNQGPWPQAPNRH